LKTRLTCWVKLHKFPFDEQHCSLVIENWIYNNNELLLEWKEGSPVSVAPHMHISEYYISSSWTNTSNEHEFYMARFHKYKQSIGSHGALVVTFRLRHQVGYYVMDYYMPSVLLVVTSWVSFWLDTDAVSGRINIGISSILTFITLSCQTGSAMPAVSYSMVSEVWFMACTTFIIGSLVEFAFVNTIWRRRQVRHVELKKVTGKHILKSTLTPKLARKQIGGRTSSGQRSMSSTSETGSTSSSPPVLSVSQIPLRALDLPQRQEDETEEVEQTQDFTNEGSKMASNGKQQASPRFTTMTPQQIAKWIDKRSRVLFPVAFLKDLKHTSFCPCRKVLCCHYGLWCWTSLLVCPEVTEEPHGKEIYDFNHA
ncbi:hypothetical protein Cfor_11301, partial [Coptotermes formosanus]